MIIESIAQVGNNREIFVYLPFSDGIDDIYSAQKHGKKIAVYALKELPITLLALQKLGISVSVLCNSNPETCGVKFFELDVINVLELFDNKDDYYFVVPSSGDRINYNTHNDIMRQLVLNGVKDFCLFKELECPSYYGHRILKKAYLDALNYLVQFHLADEFVIKQPFWDCVVGMGWWDKLYSWFYEEFSDKKSINMLEIGPGKGLFSASVKNFAANIHIDFLEVNSENPVLKFNIAERIFNFDVEVCNHEFLDYDVIVMTEVIEHFKYNPVPTLRKIKSWMKKGGMLFLSCPHWRQYQYYKKWQDMPEYGGVDAHYFRNYGHVYEFSHEELLDICNQAGFEIKREGFSIQGNSNLVLIGE